MSMYRDRVELDPQAYEAEPEEGTIQAILKLTEELKVLLGVEEYEHVF